MTKEYRVYPADGKQRVDSGLFVSGYGFSVCGTKKAAMNSAQYYADRFLCDFAVKDRTASYAHKIVQPSETI